MLSAKESKGNPNRQTLEEIVSGKKEEPSSSDDDPDPADWVKTSYTYDVTAAYYEVLTETTNGVTTAYDYGIERLSAYSGSSAWNTIKTQYVYDGRGSVAQELSNNNSWYTFGGALAKTAKKSYSYTPFGEMLENESSGFRFNHEYYDAATGMLNLRARQYEPAIVRFSQRDIWHGKVEMPTSQNRYLYCVNEPIGYYDRGGDRFDEGSGVPKKVTPSNNASKTIPFSEDSAQSQRQEQFALQKIKSANRQLENIFGRVGLDTGNSDGVISQEMEKAQQEIARKAANGTLTVKERDRIIQKACTSAVFRDGWEDIKQNIKEKILQRMGEWLSQQAQAAYDTFIYPIIGFEHYSITRGEEIEEDFNWLNALKGKNSIYTYRDELSDRFSIIKFYTTDYTNKNKDVTKRIVSLKFVDLVNLEIRIGGTLEVVVGTHSQGAGGSLNVDLANGALELSDFYETRQGWQATNTNAAILSVPDAYSIYSLYGALNQFVNESIVSPFAQEIAEYYDGLVSSGYFDNLED